MCREAIERRFAGDLLPYGQRFLSLPGLKLNVLMNLLVLGIAAPWTMKFNKWPAAEILRYSTQRIRVCPGLAVDAAPQR